MPELKSMRKASMSIIRKTERTQQNNDIKLSMFNYGFELNEDSKAIDTRSSATDNADTLHETTPNAMLETDADEVPSSIDFARSCSPGSCRDQCQGISESSKANAEINQVTTEKNTEEKMYHQRETSVCDSQASCSYYAFNLLRCLSVRPSVSQSVEQSNQSRLPFLPNYTPNTVPVVSFYDNLVTRESNASCYGEQFFNR